MDRTLNYILIFTILYETLEGRFIIPIQEQPLTTSK